MSALTSAIDRKECMIQGDLLYFKDKREISEGTFEDSAMHIDYIPIYPSANSEDIQNSSKVGGSPGNFMSWRTYSWYITKWALLFAECAITSVTSVCNYLDDRLQKTHSAHLACLQDTGLFII